MTDPTPKHKLGRVSIAGRIIDLLWTDDEFHREVSSLKKTASSNKFPRTDQWCDDEGFHMAFALAGYSIGDIDVITTGNELIITGSGSPMIEPSSVESVGDIRSIEDDKAEDLSAVLASAIGDSEYPPRSASRQIQQGIILRGIARRNFRVKYYINPEFDLSRANASMNDGLLEVTVPRSGEMSVVKIEIKS